MHIPITTFQKFNQFFSGPWSIKFHEYPLTTSAILFTNKEPDKQTVLKTLLAINGGRGKKSIFAHLQKKTNA